MRTLVVERCAPGASVQDAGRPGWRRFGVSVSGAMDRMALAVANRLVGNAATAAALELALAGATFRLEGDAALAAVAGPGVTLSVAGRRVHDGSSVLVAEGEAMTVSAPRGGVYAYLAVGGGIAHLTEMGSRSMHQRSGIGGAGLAVGDRLPIRPGGAPAPLTVSVRPASTGPIRVMAGPQADWFADETMALLVETRWTVEQRADRMGRFLAGARLTAQAGSMVSDAVVPGCIQVPPSGQPIVLMRDCQTTGGYLKIATVITADLDRFAQLPPSAAFSFALVDREEAVRAAHQAACALDALLPQKAVPANLLALNLVSGVVDARD